MDTLSRLFRGMCVALIVIVIAACGTPVASSDDSTSQPSEDTQIKSSSERALGKAIFNGTQKVDNAPPCSTCHYVEAHQRILIGPNMAGIAERAETRLPGRSGVEYMRESIRYPDAYTVEGFPPGTMNQAYHDKLTPEEIDALIAYLTTL